MLKEAIELGRKICLVLGDDTPHSPLLHPSSPNDVSHDCRQLLIDERGDLDMPRLVEVSWFFPARRDERPLPALGAVRHAKAVADAEFVETLPSACPGGWVPHQ